MMRLTHCGHDLSLHSELVRKASCEVGDAALAVPRHIRHFSDMVEHVSARKEQDGDQADPGPEITVLNHGQDVRLRDGDEGDQAEDDRCGGDQADVVDRSNYGRS